MKKEEYDRTQELLLLLAQSLDNYPLPLDEFIRAIEKADAAGPVLDPTLWQKGHKNMDRIKKIAKAVKKAQDEIREPLRELEESAKAAADGKREK